MPCAAGVSRGAGAARERTRREALALVQDESLARPALAWRLQPVRRARGARFECDAGALEIPAFAGGAGTIEALVFGACTLGPRLERRVSSLFEERRRLLALELDALGTAQLFAVADRLVARIARAARRAGLSASAALHPGDEGLALGAQPAVLALAGAGAQGIAATPAGMLNPVKSLSFVVALGRALPAAADRCDRCRSRDRCHCRPR